MTRGLNLIPEVLIRRLAKERRHWPHLVRFSALLNRIGIYFLAQSRVGLAAIYGDDRFASDKDFVTGLRGLQQKVAEVLARYQSDPSAYKYFFGQPYQGLGIAGIFGDRLSDYRFDEYELRSFIRESDHILDIGCNCGFMAVLASYRTGCRSTGIDINPHMIEIGRLAADHLRVGHLVDLKAGKLQDFRPDALFDVVLSFATHWTDDQNYRVSIDEHMTRMAGYLRPGGLLLFETHCNDVGKAEFYEAIEGIRDRFSFDGVHKRTDSGTRELYTLKRL